jgi:hypothetical protein
MDILELLCPGGDLIPEAQFLDDGLITSVQQGGSGPLYETTVASEVECVIDDGEGAASPAVTVPLSSDEAEACQTHLRPSPAPTHCSQGRTDIPSRAEPAGSPRPCS